MTVFGAAMLAYALSFVLVAASQVGETLPGFMCAEWTLSISLVIPRLFEERTAEGIALLISGWINVVFLAAVALRWRSGNGRAFRILRATTLMMIPFCWIVFYDERAYPREGHVLWIISMVLALFSESPSMRR
jgi:hypothetical protein